MTGLTFCWAALVLPLRQFAIRSVGLSRRSGYLSSRYFSRNFSGKLRKTYLGPRPLPVRSFCTVSATDSQPLQDETIFALSSGAGLKSGIAVVRISGPHSLRMLQSLTPRKKPPRPRVATLRKLYIPNSNELLDEALVLFFPSPNSFTGEDVVELHLHGSRAVIAEVVKVLADLGGRIAERGEFTRRAFERGRMDLTEVEGLADLIAAETSQQRRQALKQMGGELKKLYEGWRETLKTCLARAEACIDFTDDVHSSEFESILPVVSKLSEEMTRHLEDRRRGEIVRDGVRVAIVGPPNVGKSTLFNILAKREAAIVSPIAGTTRDTLEIHLDMNGVPVTVTDTAGLREATDDVIEREGISRAVEAASKAQLTILMQDASEIEKAGKGWKSKFKIFDHGVQDNVIAIANKVDLLFSKSPSHSEVIRTSLLRGDGIEDLLSEIESRVTALVERNSSYGGEYRDMENSPILTRERHRRHVQAAFSALREFTIGRTKSDRRHLLPIDLATEELRIATRELGAITGIVHVEEVLDVIFNEFCIGK